MMKTVNTFSEESELDFILTGSPKGVCYTSFAELDSTRYAGKVVVNGGANPYYSKSHYVGARRLSEKLRVEGRFNRLVNGRTLTHIRLDDTPHTTDSMLKFLSKTLSRRDVKFLALTHDLTICGKCGQVSRGIHGKCVRCKSPRVSVWSRDTGHLQSTRTWSPAQLQAYVDEYRFNLNGQGSPLPARKRKTIMKYRG